jgi:hypothetical protein
VKRYRCKTFPTSLLALCTGTFFSHLPFVKRGKPLSCPYKREVGRDFTIDSKILTIEERRKCEK